MRCVWRDKLQVEAMKTQDPDATFETKSGHEVRVNRHSTESRFQRSIQTLCGTEGQVWSRRRRASLRGRTISILSMQIITGYLSIVAR